MGEVAMPRLSDTMEKGTIAKWLKQPGDRLAKGEPLVEIETDKANMTLDAYESGVLERIVVPEGQTVPIGQTIAYVAAERAAGAGRPPSPPAEAAPPLTEPKPPLPPAPAPASRPSEPSTRPIEKATDEGERIKASPIARRIAQEHDVDLRQVQGTGPGERITREDVESFLRGQEVARAAPRPAVPAQPQPVVAGPAPPQERGPLSRMQATIARRMVESKTTVPHFYLTSEVTMDAAATLRQELNAAVEDGAQIGFNDMIARACAAALRKFPEVNASFRDGQIEFHEHVNIGIAVALPQGLVVPVLRDVDQKSLSTISRESRELIGKARSNRLAPSEWEGGTFTISNLGKYDVDEFAAIISPPESAILAVASIRRVPVVAEGQVVVAQRMKLTISVDHRVFYGATAAEFLREVKRLLEHPLSLLL